MAGRISQAGDARNSRKAVEQGTERPHGPVRAVTVIRIDVLPDQRDLAHAVISQPAYVLDDVCGRTRYFPAPSVGHHAERAEFVAAFLHGNESRDAPCTDRIRPWCRQETEFVVRREFGLDGTALSLGLGQELRQVVVTLGADDNVDRGRASDDFIAFRL